MSIWVFLAVYNFCLFASVSSDEIFTRQNNGNAICKADSPMNVTKARSTLECVSECQTVFKDLCKSATYLRNQRICYLFDDVIEYDFVVDPSGDCVGYQLNRDCPVGFDFIVEGDKCWKYHRTKSTWNDARTACSKDDPLANLVTVDHANDSNLLLKFISSENDVWTSGFSPYVNSTRQAFQWLLANDQTRKMGPNVPWSSREPNSPIDGSVYCVEMQAVLRGLNDVVCGSTLYFVCEA